MLKMKTTWSKHQNEEDNEAEISQNTMDKTSW